MKRMPAVALSIFLAPPLVMALSSAAISATTSETKSAVHSCCETGSTGTAVMDDETCRKLQPGRIESAVEIKTEADAFILKGRELSARMNAQIAQAEQLKREALKLQAEAERLKSKQLILIAQQSTSDSKPAESKPADSKSTDNNPADIKASDVKNVTDTGSPAAAKGTTDSTTAGATTDKTGGTTGDATAPSPPSTPSTTGAKPADNSKDEKLTGRASTLQTMPMPNIPLIKLKGPQLQQAMRQYNADVEQFKIHAADYNKHYNLFKSQVGECHAARTAFDALHKKYEMHCTAYHLNNIPPPRLCPPMAGSVAEANSIAGQLRSDQMRALRAEGQLRQEEGRLRELEGMQGNADALVVKGAERDRREREIAGMFGRLRQEYDLLEIERKTIEHSKGGKASAPVARPYVSGRIKKGK